MRTPHTCKLATKSRTTTGNSFRVSWKPTRGSYSGTISRHLHLANSLQTGFNLQNEITALSRQHTAPTPTNIATTSTFFLVRNALSFKELTAKLHRNEECIGRYYRPELPGYMRTNRKQASEPIIQFLGRPCTTRAF